MYRLLAIDFAPIQNAFANLSHTLCAGVGRLPGANPDEYAAPLDGWQRFIIESYLPRTRGAFAVYCYLPFIIRCAARERDRSSRCFRTRADKDTTIFVMQFVCACIWMLPSTFVCVLSTQARLTFRDRNIYRYMSEIYFRKGDSKICPIFQNWLTLARYPRNNYSSIIDNWTSFDSFAVKLIIGL